MLDHRRSRDAVKHLREGGFHPRALSRGEHDDVEISHDQAAFVPKARPRLSRGTRTDRAPAFRTQQRRRFECRRERVVGPEGIEIGIGAGQSAILGIQGYRAFHVRDGFSQLAALCVGDGEHVQRVVIVRILVSNETEVRDRFVVPAAVQRDRGSVKTLLDGLRDRLVVRRLFATDVQIQPDAFVQFLFIGILPEDRLESVGGAGIIVSLEMFEALLV
jgi:hypothetical protein